MNNEIEAVGGLTFAKDNAAGVEMGTHRAVGEQSNMPVAHTNEKWVCGDLFFKLNAFWSKLLELRKAAQVQAANAVLP